MDVYGRRTRWPKVSLRAGADADAVRPRTLPLTRERKRESDKESENTFVQLPFLCQRSASQALWSRSFV